MDFRELEVYKKAYKLTISIYKYALRMPEEEKYILTSHKKYIEKYQEVSKMISGLIKKVETNL